MIRKELCLYMEIGAELLDLNKRHLALSQLSWMLQGTNNVFIYVQCQFQGEEV